MWRNGCECSPSLEFGSYPAQLGTGHGVEVEHRALDGASRSLEREFEEVIMVEVRIDDDVCVGRKPIERLRTSRGRRSRGQRRRRKTTLGSERRSVFKKDLREK
jgi:hypothetical protein